MAHQTRAAASALARGRARRIASRHVSVALLLSAFMMLGGILLYLWPQVRLVSLGYRQSALLQQRAQLLQRQKELHVERGSLRQLRRIEDIAAQHLGLRPPHTSQVFYVQQGHPTAGHRRE